VILPTIAINILSLTSHYCNPRLHLIYPYAGKADVHSSDNFWLNYMQQNMPNKIMFLCSCLIPNISRFMKFIHRIRAFFRS